MIRNGQRLVGLSKNYDTTRSASDTIVRALQEYLKPDPTKVGADIGCGTGNYTLPFVDKFREVIGVDILDEMLQVARSKPNAKRVRWIPADALNTTLRNEECDAVWLISTLHYFAGKRQKLLFQEIYRILKPDGVVVADTEFAEQHPSLWVVEYFPSLRERFKDACLSVEQYRTWLQEIGFSNIR